MERARCSSYVPRTQPAPRRGSALQPSLCCRCSAGGSTGRCAAGRPAGPACRRSQGTGRKTKGEVSLGDRQNRSRTTQRESSQVHAVPVRTALRFLWSFGCQKTTEQHTAKAERTRTPPGNEFGHHNPSSLRGHRGCPALPEQGHRLPESFPYTMQDTAATIPHPDLKLRLTEVTESSLNSQS